MIGSMSALLRPDGNEIIEAGLRIRPWRAQDTAAVYRACQDPVIQRWTNVPRPYLPEHAEGFVTTFTENSWATGSAAPFGVFDASTGEMLGSTGLVMVNLARAEAEIGYWTAPWARGRGHATVAARGLARWALSALDLNRLIWRAGVGNHVSRLVAERIGVRVEGVLRQSITRPDGRVTDAWTGSLLPGQLREADTPIDPAKALRAATFARSQPGVAARTSTACATSVKHLLRPPEVRDIPEMAATFEDPKSVWATPPEDARSFVIEYAPERWTRGEGAVFAIVNDEDAFVGFVDLRLTGPGTGEVGYLVAPWARGRGYASESLRAVCGWAFEQLGLRRIEWRAQVGNDASRRVAEKAGFTIEGVARGACRRRDEYVDAWTGAKLTTDPR
jgi:RimJ/RimL family protein N-acetyltransferase